MDDHSEEESHYRSKRYFKKRESSDSPLSISDDEEEDIGEPLEIRPPQAKIKHSHYRHLEKHSSSSRRTHRHKSHHSRRHQDERYFKERVEPEFKSSRSVHPKDYELERIKEYEAYKRKKYAHHIRREEKAAKAERYRAYQEELQKEQDLREKLERRKLHHELKEYYKKERKEREHRKRSKSDKDKDLYEHKEKRRKHHDEKSRKRESPEKLEPPTYKKSTIVFESEDSVKPGGKEMVVDIEMSPPVLKCEFDKYKVDSGEKERVVEEDIEEEEEGEVADNSEEGTSSESSSNSSSSNSDGSDSSDSSSSSSSSKSSSGSSEVEVVPENESKPIAKEEETEEVEVAEEGEEEVEVAEEVKREIKEETPTPVVATNEDVDNDIELEKDTLPAYFPAIQGCRSVEEFQCLNHINEGTYGVVYRAKEKKTNKIVALKRLKMEKEKDGFPVTSLREINTLLKAQHPNIVTVKEIVVGSNMDKIFIVMDYVEHDLKSLMETMKKKKSSFTSSEVKCLMLQLLRAVNHLHDNWILHRDLKTSNLLLTHGGVLKVGDFGLAREYGSPLKPYTPIVVTLWYRAPELLLGAKRYSTFVDMWSVGCIFAEFLLMEPLFPGKAEIDQLTRIFKALGTPNETTWPEFFMLPVTQKVKFAKYPPNNIKSKFVPKNLTEMGYDLLIKFLTYNTKTRISADTALKHEYFNESPLPIDPSMFPTWPAKSEPGYRKAIMNSPKPPPGGQANKELDDDGFYIPADNKNPRGFSLQSTFNLKF